MKGKRALCVSRSVHVILGAGSKCGCQELTLKGGPRIWLWSHCSVSDRVNCWGGTKAVLIQRGM